MASIAPLIPKLKPLYDAMSVYFKSPKPIYTIRDYCNKYCPGEYHNIMKYMVVHIDNLNDCMRDLLEHTIARYVDTIGHPDVAMTYDVINYYFAHIYTNIDDIDNYIFLFRGCRAFYNTTNMINKLIPDIIISDSCIADIAHSNDKCDNAVLHEFLCSVFAIKFAHGTLSHQNYQDMMVIFRHRTKYENNIYNAIIRHYREQLDNKNVTDKYPYNRPLLHGVAKLMTQYNIYPSLERLFDINIVNLPDSNCVIVNKINLIDLATGKLYNGTEDDPIIDVIEDDPTLYTEIMRNMSDNDIESFAHHAFEHCSPAKVVQNQYTLLNDIYHILQSRKKYNRIYYTIAIIKNDPAAIKQCKAKKLKPLSGPLMQYMQHLKSKTLFDDIMSDPDINVNQFITNFLDTYMPIIEAKPLANRYKEFAKGAEFIKSHIANK